MKTQNFYKKIIVFSAKTGIPASNIVDLFMVLGHGPVDNLSLGSLTGLSKLSINLVEKEFYSLFKPTANTTQLSENGQRVFLYLKDLLPDYIKDTPIQAETRNLMHSRYSDSRLETDRDLDQFLATSNTVSRRTTLLNNLCDIRDKRLLLLGDDDFTSIELAMYNPEKLVVADIDDRILKKISEISSQEKLSIETVRYDARESMDKTLWNQFDIVFTDPPYTENGFNLFLSRAVDALDQNNKSARIYICFGNSDLSKERYLPVNESISKSGLITRYVFNKFNRYIGAESIGSNSDLFVCEVTAKTTPFLKGKFKENLYTNNA